MIFKGKKYKIAMLLGAGATRGALRGVSRPVIRAPLNKDFFEVAKRFISCPEGRRYKNCFIRVSKFISDQMMPFNKRHPTMEEVFSTLFMSKDLPVIFKTGRGRIRKEGFRPEIRDFLVLLIAIFRFLQMNLKHKDNIDHYARLVAKLEEGDSIITLNYDTLVDNALLGVGWRPENGYGFNASSKIIYSNLRAVKRRFKNVYLLKPHGSLNWFARGKISNLEETLSRKNVSRIDIANAPRLYTLKQDKYVRFFIPPLYTKFFNNDFWRYLWHESYLRLKNCNCLIIIGCSLITTDYHLRAILSKVLKSKKKFKKIIIVDKNLKVVGNLKKFFRGASFSGCETYNTFTEYIESLN
ncbi:MAG: SIR2 family protein [Candidatus Omnitrophota bacterium]|jgi:NAD-dependent SIR2 family protein deacetylase